MLYVNKRGEDDDVDVKRCDVWDLVNLVSNFHEHKVDGKDNAFHRKKTCDFLILFGNWPTLLETKHIPHHLPEENHLPSNLWSGYVTVAWRASFQTMNLQRNTFKEFAPSQYKLRTKILEFCRSSKPPVARSRNPGSYQTQKHFGNFGVPKRWGFF